jgi:hypothetical protein
MSKNRTYSSNIPKDALIFEVNGVKWERIYTDLKYHDVKNLETGEIKRGVPHEKIKKYLKY